MTDAELITLRKKIRSGKSLSRQETWDALDAITTLRAQLAAETARADRAEAERAAQIEVDGWQPIETAPKHGVMVDLWCRAFHGRDCRVTDMWWTDRTGWRNGKNDAYAGSMSERATHWRFPPQDPTVAQPHDRTALDAAIRAAKVEAWREGGAL